MGLIESAKRLIDATRAFRLVRPVMGGVGTILMFHRVLPADAEGPGSDGRLTDLAVTPELLDTLLHFFRAKGYAVVSLDELSDRLAQGRFPERAVCFTFDDGYRDNLTHALPVFRVHDAPFAVYVTTCFPDRTATLWWYMIEDLVLTRDRVDIPHGDHSHTFDTSTPDGARHAYDAIRRVVLDQPQEAVREVVEELFAPFGMHPDDYADLAMTWDEVETLAREPLVTIAAHTKNHLNLKQLDDDALAYELEAGKRELEERLSAPVRHFAYPFGTRHECGPREFAAAAAAGFDTMTTTRLGNVFSVHDAHRATLPRIGVSERYRDLVVFERNLSGTSSLFVNGLKRVVTE